jgi:hypothetical protein
MDSLKALICVLTFSSDMWQVLEIVGDVDAPNPSDELRQRAVNDPDWVLARVLVDMFSTEEKIMNTLKVRAL